MDLFESLGIRDAALPQKHFRTFAGPLYIVGSARCVWDDLERVGKCPGDVMTVNDMTMHFPYDVRHVYSNHADQLGKWIGARRLTYNTDVMRHSCNPYPGVTHWPVPGHGTSALNAVYVGLALGYDRIVLCGIPLDNSGHYFDPPWVRTAFEKEVPTVPVLNKKPDQIKWWQSARDNVFNGRVTSLSGRTRELLGE